MTADGPAAVSTTAIITEFAAAKINLALHITGRRADGYHILDSIVVFADVGDRVTVRRADRLSLHVSGPRAGGIPTDDENLVLRAARTIGGAPARIGLEKHLPAASGIGGGSADAAATLRALHRLDGRPLPSDPGRLGADVPVCLAQRPARMRGIGDDLGCLPDLPPLHLCLVNPGVPVATGAVFAALASAAHPPLPDLPRWADCADAARWLARQRNDLEGVAIRLAPPVADTLAAIAGSRGCLLARMSGSGATCFGLYADAAAARDAARALARHGWWVVSASALA